MCAEGLWVSRWANIKHYNSKHWWIWSCWEKKRRRKKTPEGSKLALQPKLEGVLMKWFPLLFANVKTLFFTSAIFDNIAIWEDSSLAIFSHYKANYSWMSRQFPDNRWCCRDRHWSLLLSVFFCWWQYISLCGWNLKYSSILSAGANYSLLRPCRDSIPQSVCWTWLQQEWPIPSGLQLSLPYLLFFTHTSSLNVSFLLCMIGRIIEHAAAHG